MSLLASKSVRSARREPAVQRLKLENEAHSLTLPTVEIEAVEAAADRVRIYSGAATYVAMGRLADLLPRLAPAFVRVTRTMVVNAARVDRCAPFQNGVEIHFRGGRSIRVVGRHAAMALALPILAEASQANG